MGREWFDEVATRPGGYTGSYAFWVEGPGGQASFDERVLKEARDCTDVLDCGCGDGTFTLRVAKTARHVVGVDFSSKMIETARRCAQANAVANVTFVLSHAREPHLFAKGRFDLAYSRRGPHILAVVPEFVRQGRLLMAIHPEDASPASYVEQIVAAGLEYVSCHRYDDRLHFPTLNDLAEYLSRQPGMLDLRTVEHRVLLLEKAREYATLNDDFVIPRSYLMWVARKPTPS